LSSSSHLVPPHLPLLCLIDFVFIIIQLGLFITSSRPFVSSLQFVPSSCLIPLSHLFNSFLRLIPSICPFIFIVIIFVFWSMAASEHELLLNFRVVDPKESRQEKSRRQERRRREKLKNSREQKEREQKQAEEERRQQAEEEERQKKELEKQQREAETEELAQRQNQWAKKKRNEQKHRREESPTRRRRTRTQAHTQPILSWGMIELQQLASLICLLACPYCCQLTLQCQDWREFGGGFGTTLSCTHSECEFSTRFHSTSSLVSNYHR